MFLIFIKYTVPLETILLHVESHRAYLQKFFDSKHLICSGPLVPRTGGVILSCHSNRQLVDEFIKGDPFYSHQLAAYDIIEFEPVKYAEECAVFIEQ